MNQNEEMTVPNVKVKFASKELKDEKGAVTGSINLIIAYFPETSDVEVVDHDDIVSVLDSVLETRLGSLDPEEAFAIAVAAQLMRQLKDVKHG